MALLFCCCLLLGLVVTNVLTIAVLSGVLLAVLYPFMKRVTHLPQFVLGTLFHGAYRWHLGVAGLPAGMWWLFFANLLWTVAYDTPYAMVDREDDLAVGIKSTAILFDRLDTRIIGVLQLATVAAFVATGLSFELGSPTFLSLSVAGMFAGISV